MLCPVVRLEHSKKVRELLYRRILRAWRHNTKKADASHIHDDRYYTEAEINKKFSMTYLGTEHGILVLNPDVCSGATITATYTANMAHIAITAHLSVALTGYARHVIGWLQEPVKASGQAYGIAVIQGTRDAIVIETDQTGAVTVWGYGAPDVAAGAALSGGLSFPLYNKL